MPVELFLRSFLSIVLFSLLAGAGCLYRESSKSPEARGVPALLEVGVNWGKVLLVSRTTATLQVVVSPLWMFGRTDLPKISRKGLCGLVTVAPRKKPIS